jgi:hypothetical protein
MAEARMREDLQRSKILKRRRCELLAALLLERKPSR